MNFFVPGIPVTQGSTRAFVVNGRARVTHEHRDQLLNWRNAIAYAAREAAQGEFWKRGEPVSIAALFYLPRPARAPKRVTRPTKKPDLDKLARSVLDALTGVVFDDDSQVTCLGVYKAFATDECGVSVSVEAAI